MKVELQKSEGVERWQIAFCNSKINKKGLIYKLEFICIYIFHQ